MTHHHSYQENVRADLDRRLNQSRELIAQSLLDLSHESTTSTLIPGQPTMLGIVKHTAFVEAVWFGEAITGEPRKTYGVPTATANSWKIRKPDTTETVLQLCRDIQERVQEHLHPLQLNDIPTRNNPHTVHGLYLQVLTELSWNIGQLDTLRAIVLAPSTQLRSDEPTHPSERAQTVLPKP